MPTEPSPTQHAFVRNDERSEPGAQRSEPRHQGASDPALRQLLNLRERVERGLEEQRTLLVGRVSRLGASLQQTSNQLTREDQLAQELLDGASTRLQRVASYLDNARRDDVVHDLGAFARRQPAVFFGGAFLVGLVLGRLGNSSTTRDDDQSPGALPGTKS